MIKKSPEIRLPIYFVGDPHDELPTVVEDLLWLDPGHVVIVGDLELPGPAQTVFAGVMARHATLHWIAGNHDSDTCQAWGWLASPKFGLPQAFLGNRVVGLSGIDVAGLSGVYKGRIWMPPADPKYLTRKDWMRNNRERWNGGLPLQHMDTIWPEDHEILGRLRADVLVSHEGPSSVWMDMGHSAIDDLAAKMRCQWIIHGHHHHSGTSTLANGVKVKSLGIGEIWRFQS